LRNLITPSRPDLSVDLPMSELRKALPNEPFPELATPAPEAAPQQPAPLFKAFTPPPMTAAPSNAPDLVFGTPTTPPPFFQAAPPPVELSSPSPADSAWPLQPGTPEPEPAPVAEPAELASAFSFLKDEPEITAAAATDDTVIDITPATEEPVQSAAEVTPPQAQAQAPAPPAPPQPPSEPTGITKAAIRVINPAPASQSASQMVLRALLNTDEPLDASAVMQLMACQPGIVAVVCLRDGICLASAGNGGAEAEHFLNQAPKLHHHVKPLIELTGAHDTETFSMNSGPFVITFSLQSDVTLGVLHDPRTQGPALRERVILIARELTPLLAPPAA
ncbi:MAG TPA: hypothetical protein VLE43_21195, partial [Candidatus Saccharimonadia bacterium]|nr:hypothetical protein [Candidatus Saccharimonadia bacterium]